MSTRDLTADLAEYEAKRNALIAKDRCLRLDARDAANISELGKQADQVVRGIRAEEAQSIWAKDYPDILHPFPGMEFLTG